MLVISDNKSGDRVPVQVGTLIIDKILRKIPVKEIIKLEKWRRSHLTAGMARQVQVELKPEEVLLDLMKITGDARTIKK